MNNTRLTILAILSVAPFRLMMAGGDLDHEPSGLEPGGFFRQITRQEFAFNAISTSLGLGSILVPELPQGADSTQDSDEPQGGGSLVLPPIPESFDFCRADLTGKPIIEMPDAQGKPCILEVVRDDQSGGKAYYHANGKKYWVEWEEGRLIFKDTHPKQAFAGRVAPEIKKAIRLPVPDAIGSTSPIVSVDKQGAAIVRDGSLSAQLMHILRELDSIKQSMPGNLPKELLAFENLNATQIAKLTTQVDRIEEYLHTSVELLTKRILQTLLLTSRIYNIHPSMAGKLTQLSDLDMDLSVPPGWMHERRAEVSHRSDDFRH
jgi:hypothetical protein